ncbi:hypothetical protein OI70_21650 [Dickeya fangzhongdai]|nr:hypothetical protein LH89_03465 [Dickeya fangzhongdai]KGT99725.1 hypothetical protein NM75_02615 [Dickeya fangzhongdai]KHN50539.1 hypothetical protein OI70_21650 [Dickeya fangzhongdai]
MRHRRFSYQYSRLIETYIIPEFIRWISYAIFTLNFSICTIAGNKNNMHFGRMVAGQLPPMITTQFK